MPKKLILICFVLVLILLLFSSFIIHVKMVRDPESKDSTLILFGDKIIIIRERN